MRHLINVALPRKTIGCPRLSGRLRMFSSSKVEAKLRRKSSGGPNETVMVKRVYILNNSSQLFSRMTREEVNCYCCYFHPESKGL